MPCSQKGFSLVELMVVVGILVIVGMVSVPTLVSTHPAYKLKKSVRDLCSNLRKARSLAIKLNRDMTVAFNKRSYSIDGGSPIKLESGVSFGPGIATSAAPPDPSLPDDGILFEDNRVAFNSRGLVTPITNRGNSIFTTNVVFFV